MFVVNTVSQLEEAVLASAKEIIVLGSLAPDLLENKPQSEPGDQYVVSANSKISRLCEGFSVSRVYKEGDQLTAVLVKRQPDSFSLTWSN